MHGGICSHVVALLFTAEANSLFKEQTSLTSFLCVWLPPSFQCVPYVEVSKMDFKTSEIKEN